MWRLMWRLLWRLRSRPFFVFFSLSDFHTVCVLSRDTTRVDIILQVSASVSRRFAFEAVAKLKNGHLYKPRNFTLLALYL
jgi:hypothetical protein